MKSKRPFFKHYKKIYVNEFKGYSAGKFIKDILAGLTVAAVALPLALAFGAASVDAKHAAIGISAGLITAIISGIVIGGLGGGSFQISGPTGAMTVVLGEIVAGVYGLQGMFFACFMAGIILLIAGLFRLGKLIQFIPRPVVTGFTSGIAVVIALGQLGNFFGISLSGTTTINKVVHLFSNQMNDINKWSVICSVILIAIMAFYPKKFNKYVPGSLVGIIVLSLIVLIFKIDVTTIGKIPSSLINSVHLDPSEINLDMIKTLIGPAFTISALGMIESLLCGVCAAKLKDEKFDSNVELVAQGIGNIIIPFFGGVPSTAAIARTSVAVKSGGQTRIASIIHSLFLILCMFALPKVIGEVPYAALAGVLIVTAFKMNDWSAIKSYFKNKMWDAIALYSITMIATVVLDLTYAIMIGVILSLCIMVKNTKIQIESSAVNGELLDDSLKEKEAVIIYCTGSLFFANANELEKIVMEEAKKYDHFIFVMRGITYMDVSATDALCDLIAKLEMLSKTFCFTGVNQTVYKPMKRGGFVDLVGEEKFFTSIDKVLLSSKSNN